MALKGCDTEEHNVPKPTGNFKKETCTKALTNLGFFPTEFLALFTPEKQARNLNTEEGGQGVGGVCVCIYISQKKIS